MASSSVTPSRDTTKLTYSTIYQPPQSTPSTRRPTHDYFSTSTLSRKRMRADSSVEKSMCADAWVSNTAWTDTDFDGVASTLVSDRYSLRDGFDTPALLAHGELDTHVSDVDLNARRTMQEPVHSLRITDPSFAGPLARERNGYARRSEGVSHQKSPSWTRFAITLPFSIAGKMFSFGSTVLKGFYAGNGQGYSLDNSSDKTDYWDAATPIPGSWYESPPTQSLPADFDQEDTPTSRSRPPPNKRRLTDKDSWVMVGTPDIQASRPPSPAKTRNYPVTSPRSKRPSIARRKSHAALSRRQSCNTVNGSPAHTQAYSPQTTESRTLPRLSMPIGHISPSRQSPTNAQPFASPDAERFARRQAKQERATERTMNSMSRQLEELIRQGQAALGTKFSVEAGEYHEDEGFVDDDGY